MVPPLKQSPRCHLGIVSLPIAYGRLKLLLLVHNPLCMTWLPYAFKSRPPSVYCSLYLFMQYVLSVLIQIPIPGSPTEFRRGRRASDGFVCGRKVVPFTNKLEGARAGGVTTLADTSQLDEELSSDMATEDEGCVGVPPNPEPPLTLLCSPFKRPSLPDAWRLLPEPSRFKRDTGNGAQWTQIGDSGSNPAQLHRQLMALRLHRKNGSGSGESGGNGALILRYTCSLSA